METLVMQVKDVFVEYWLLRMYIKIADWECIVSLVFIWWYSTSCLYLLGYLNSPTLWCNEIDFIAKLATILDAQLFLLPQNVPCREQTQ